MTAIDYLTTRKRTRHPIKETEGTISSTIDETLFVPDACLVSKKNGIAKGDTYEVVLT